MRRARFATVFVCCLLLTVFPKSGLTEAAPDPVNKPDTIIDEIAKCGGPGLEDSVEFYVPDRRCVPFRNVEKTASAKYAEQQPFGDEEKDIREACDNPQQSRYKDRILKSNIVRSFKKAPGPQGLRIIGAIFCDPLDLAGLELTYPLYIERSHFRRGVIGRNLHAKGDLSFDRSIVLGKLDLGGAKIDGWLWARGAFFEELEIVSVEIKGGATFRGSVVLKQALFRSTVIGQDLTFNGAALSNLTLENSRVTSELDLNSSEARCAYIVRASAIGRVTADGVGIGLIKPLPASLPKETSNPVYLWWNRGLTTVPSQLGNTKPVAPDEGPMGIFVSRGIAETLAKFEGEVARNDELDKDRRDTIEPKSTGCGDESKLEQTRFAFVDSSVQGKFCLSHFSWLQRSSPADDAQHETVVALNSTQIPGNLWIDLHSSSSSKRDESLRKKRRLEAIGLSIGGLVLNFGHKADYVTWLDGITFQRVAKPLEGTVSCASAVSDVKDTLPTSEDVVDWLDLNEAPSSQPFKAFIDAFERAGADATDLRVERKTRDLQQRTCQSLPGLRKLFWFDCGKTSTSGPHSASMFGWASDIGTIVFQWLMVPVADHGLRPAKAAWSLLVVLGGFLVIFWVYLNIVGFEPKRDDKEAGPRPGTDAAAPWPISLLFLFDRLIPAYKIRKEHYEIRRFYSRAGKDGTEPAQYLRYFGRTFRVRPATDAEIERAERWLIILRIIGVVLAVFLLAALNALISKE